VEKKADAPLPVLLISTSSSADVVPVDPTTLSSWSHPAFSGYIDEKEGLVYGRGAGDDKGEHSADYISIHILTFSLATASLISLLTSFESLLPFGFEPKRSIILSFGFDEESSGTQGGEALAKQLETVYGSHKDGKGVYMIVDEGAGLDGSSFGIPVAAPATSEKGYLDVKITVNGKGGHSSEPPRHTTIGILSRIISLVEDTPWVPTLFLKEDDGKEDSPGLQTLLCLRDAPKIRGTKLGKSMDKLVEARQRVARVSTRKWHKACSFMHSSSRARKNLQRAKEAFLEAVEESGELGAFVTTQAVDLIGGGVKINALPEEASTVINHRINVEESVQDVRDHLVKLVESIASRYSCKVAEWGQVQSSTAGSTIKGCVIVLQDAYDSALEPAPRTPTEGSHAVPFQLLSSVIRSTWKLQDGKHVRVVPSLMQGNTDTKSYHALTRHIFRFSPNSLLEMKGPADGGIHTVDERVQIDSLTKGFEFYTTLMTAVQE
jgi:Gly-Xaa carboxypeptidase